MRALCCEKASGAIGRGAFAWLPSVLCPTLVSVSLSQAHEVAAKMPLDCLCPYDAAAERVAERAAARTAERWIERRCHSPTVHALIETRWHHAVEEVL